MEFPSITQRLAALPPKERIEQLLYILTVDYHKYQVQRLVQLSKMYCEEMEKMIRERDEWNKSNNQLPTL